MRKLWLRVAPMVAAACLLLAVDAAYADDYVLGPEDVISVSVWMHPELERALTINADGNVTLPPIGELKAAGLTPKQFGDRLADRLSAYLRQTTTVTVTVTQFLSRSVFVTGGVAKPGRYGFERIPSLPEVLGQAGGAIPGADLSSVQVLRREGTARRTIAVDLSAALRTGDASGLPDLKPGDTVVVPGAPAVGGGGAMTAEGVGVIGEVNRPGIYTVTAGQDIWSVLASAGGVTANGSLHDVRVLARGESGRTVTTLDLQEALSRGDRAAMTIKPGDVVFVMRRGSAWTVFTNVMALSRDALNVAVLVDYFNSKKK